MFRPGREHHIIVVLIHKLLKLETMDWFQQTLMQTKTKDTERITQSYSSTKDGFSSSSLFKGWKICM